MLILPPFIYLFIYILFGPVKSDLGVIPSGREDYSRVNILNFPGKELNITGVYSDLFYP